MLSQLSEIKLPELSEHKESVFLDLRKKYNKSAITLLNELVDWTEGWVWPLGKHGAPLRINKAAWNSNRPWNYIIQHDLRVLMSSVVAFAFPAYPHTTNQTITPPHLQSNTQLGSASCCELNATILNSQMLLAFACLRFFSQHTHIVEDNPFQVQMRNRPPAASIYYCFQAFLYPCIWSNDTWVMKVTCVSW